MLLKRNLVLKSVDNKNSKAILSLQSDGFETTGTLRLYNFSSEPLGIISLGIFADGRVEKAGLTRVENMLYSFACNIKKLPTDFSCAVVNFSQGQPNAILYGSSSGMTEKEEVFDNVLMGLKKSSSMKDVEKLLDENGIDYDSQLQEEVDAAINSCSGICENCEYKKYYFSHINSTEKMSTENAVTLENKGEEIDELMEENKENKFYDEIKKQIDELFSNNPSEEYLQKLIPNSKWTRVKVDDFGNYYVLGLIWQEEELKYICYGVPGVYQELPPRHLSGFPIWFPLDEDEKEGFGYWLSYQDADTGESVKAVLV